MLRAFSTLGCPDADLDAAIALAAKFGLDGLELRALADTINLPSYLATHYGAPEGFGLAARAFKIPIVALDTSLHLADAKSSDREQFLAFVPWAEAAGIRWLRVFDGGTHLSERGAIAAAAETVKWWRDVREEYDYGVDIMVETHNRLFNTPTIKRFLNAAPTTSLLWDSHHTWKQGGEDPVATWRAIQAHVVHIHIKDSVPIPTPTHPYKYVLPGAGDFPAAALRGALGADNFSGVLSLEWEKLWHPDLPSLDVALRTAADSGWW